MAVAIAKLNVDCFVENHFTDLVAVKEDYLARFIDASIRSNGAVVHVDKGSAVAISALRPDGQGKTFAGSVNADGTVRVPVTQWMIDVLGRVRCSIQVMTGSTKLSTSRFYILVQAPPHVGEISPDDPEHDLIIEVLANEEQRKQNEIIRQANEETRIANETVRVDNEAERVAAEKIRKENETKRLAAETQRVTDENQRIANEKERIANEIERQKWRPMIVRLT